MWLDLKHLDWSDDSMRVARIVSVVFIAACVSSQTAEIESARQAEIDRVADRALRKLITASCSEDKASQDSPSMRRVRYGDTVLVQACGMITVEVLAEVKVQQFTGEVCGGQDGPECGAKLWDMFIARLGERYVFADWKKVTTKCRAHPIECKTWSSIELWAMDSHNDGVKQWASEEFDETNKRYAAEFERAYAEESERRQRIGDAFAAMGKAIAPPPRINCTANTYGTTTTMNCY
jgi:hypothetical protein